MTYTAHIADQFCEHEHTAMDGHEHCTRPTAKELADKWRLRCHILRTWDR